MNECWFCGEPISEGESQCESCRIIHENQED